VKYNMVRGFPHIHIYIQEGERGIKRRLEAGEEGDSRSWRIKAEQVTAE